MREITTQRTGGEEGAIGKGVLALLQSPRPPRAEEILTTLINDISASPATIIFVLDDYHLVDSQAVDDALSFLLKQLPPQLHLVIAMRVDPAFWSRCAVRFVMLWSGEMTVR